MSLIALLATQMQAPKSSDADSVSSPIADMNKVPLRRLTWEQAFGAGTSPYLLKKGQAVTGTTVSVGDSRIRLIGSRNPVDVGLPSAHSFEFKYTGSAISFIAEAQRASRDVAFRVYVDGLPTSDSFINPGAGVSTWRLDFGEPKERVIRIDNSLVNFGGIGITAGAQLAPTAARSKLYILGDSWVQGASYTAEGNGPGIEHMAFLTARLLDASPIIAGIGGTGYLNGSTASPQRHYSAANRLENIRLYRPDYLLVFGSINDNNSQGAAEAMRASATALYEFVGKNLPDTKILVSGVQDWNSDLIPADSSPGVTQAVAEAENVVGYIQPVRENWVAAGDVTINNKAYNDAHLTAYGNRFYAEKMADFLAETLQVKE